MKEILNFKNFKKHTVKIDNFCKKIKKEVYMPGDGIIGDDILKQIKNKIKKIPKKENENLEEMID